MVQSYAHSQSLIDRFQKGCATFFGVGYLPVCPGTWASLIALLLFFILYQHVGVLWLCVGFFVGLGFWIGNRAYELFGCPDPQQFVLDEVAALLILLACVPIQRFFIVVAFILFRLFDVLKPFPIKKIERFSGSWGIMLDDLAAACYAWLCVYGIVLIGLLLRR